MIAISLQRLTKRFGAVTALDAIDLQIQPGEIFFLLGPSGCGKTTLLRSIAGFHLPDEGRILFDQEDVTHLPPYRRETGMMFQSYALWPHKSVAQNIAFGLEERRVPKPEVKRRVQEALAAVQMTGLGDRRIHELSGGQQQRVALARAMVVRPRCLLLDEPLSNLDAKLRLEMRGEIRRICREAGLTAIYVTHDQKEALSIADRLAVLRHGRVMQTGAPLEVYRQPRSRFVAEFMGETNFLGGQVLVTKGAEVRVKTPLGDLLVRSGAGPFPVHAPVTLSIRPESWKLTGPSGATVNSAPVRVIDRVYLGDQAQYTLSPLAAAEQVLKAVELNPQAAPAGGEPALYASVAPEDIVILPPE